MLAALQHFRMVMNPTIFGGIVLTDKRLRCLCHTKKLPKKRYCQIQVLGESYHREYLAILLLAYRGTKESGLPNQMPRPLKNLYRRIQASVIFWHNLLETRYQPLENAVRKE